MPRGGLLLVVLLSSLFARGTMRCVQGLVLDVSSFYSARLVHSRSCAPSRSYARSRSVLVLALAHSARSSRKDGCMARMPTRCTSDYIF